MAVYLLPRRARRGASRSIARGSRAADAAASQRRRDLLRSVIFCGPAASSISSVDDDGSDDAEVADRAAKEATTALHAIQALGALKVSRPGGCDRHSKAQRITGKPSRITSRSRCLGLGRTIAAEHPALWAVWSIRSRRRFERRLRRAVTASSSADDEDQVAFRDGVRYVARLTATDPSSLARREFRWRPDAAYLLTGGFGGIGLEIARWMVRHGARRLILLGRHALPARAAWRAVDPQSAEAARIDAVLELEALGASIEAAPVDVGDAGQLSEWFATYCREQRPPIRGVVHAAGVTQYQLLSDHRNGDLEAVWRGKVTGAWLLDRLLADTPLDFFVPVLVGIGADHPPLVGSYAAANAFLDAIAERRRGSGQRRAQRTGARGRAGMAAGAGTNGVLRADEPSRPRWAWHARHASRARGDARRRPADGLAEWSRLYPAFAAAPFLPCR